MLSVLGAAALLAVPATAYASAAAPAHKVTGEIMWFTGYTYPETAAGLAACNAKGETYVSQGVGSYTCFADNPDAGQYGLFVFKHVGAGR
jgi:hypothetical protein